MKRIAILAAAGEDRRPPDERRAGRSQKEPTSRAEKPPAEVAYFYTIPARKQE